MLSVIDRQHLACGSILVEISGDGRGTFGSRGDLGWLPPLQENETKSVLVLSLLAS